MIDELYKELQEAYYETLFAVERLSILLAFFPQPTNQASAANE